MSPDAAYISTSPILLTNSYQRSGGCKLYYRHDVLYAIFARTGRFRCPLVPSIATNLLANWQPMQLCSTLGAYLYLNNDINM